ncbi:MAG: FAD-dependent oxidoreductase, partial [Longimicrobiales bacterium]
IKPVDSVERFEGLGVRVITEYGAFTGRNTVQAGAHEITARRIVIATGSSPLVPPIPGLDGVPHFTNETIFDLRDRPDHLLIIGGGPIGMELACRPSTGPVGNSGHHHRGEGGSHLHSHHCPHRQG